MVKKHYIHELIFVALLIMCSKTRAFSQTVISDTSSVRSTMMPKDTIYTIDESFENQIKISARDSIFSHYKNQTIELFGEAKLNFEEIELTADYMLIDLEKKEVYATYTLDKDSNRVGTPKFTDGSETIDASSIRYNFDTKKGYIQEVKIKQEENFLYMEVAKRQSNDEVHFLKGRFTTCDLEEPHFHFQLSRAIMIPNKRIVSGPMNLWIKGVPTPLGLPFIFLPQKKQELRKKGILFPQLIPFSQYGMGIQDLGYYLPINDSLQTTFTSSIYTRGTWGIGNRTDYKIRYKFDGNIEVRYDQFKIGFPQKDPKTKLTVNWNHRQDQKANPFWNFSSAVQFQSDNNPKNSTNPLNQSYFNNSFNSDINLQRFFPGKPITMGIKSSLRQNSISKNFVTTLPVFNTNVTRFFPLKGFVKNTIGTLNPMQKFLTQLGMSYNLEAQNSGTFQDSLLTQKRYDLIQASFQQGVTQNTTLQTTLSLFKDTWKFTPSINYSNQVNFQQIRKSYDPILNTSKDDTLQKIGMSQTLSMNVSATTVVYSYYQFIGKKKPLLRHILTPSFGFRYLPQINSYISDSVGANQAQITYSPFEKSMYRSGVSKSQGLVTFGFNNTFELKRISEKDTLTGFKKSKIIDAFSISGSYDLMRDSMNLSNLSLGLRINPIEFFNFTASSSFSPYAWNDSTGAELGKYALQNKQGLGRFTNINFNSSFVLAPKKSREKIQENNEIIQQNWTSDYQQFALHPEKYVDFEIPWKLSITHIWALQSNTNKLSSFYGNKNYIQTQTISFNGDLSFTKRWKVVAESFFDFKTQKITYARFTMTRNLHCWNLSFFWTPLGGNQSFVFRLNANSSLFQDAKIEVRKPPELF